MSPFGLRARIAYSGADNPRTIECKAEDLCELKLFRITPKEARQR